MTVATKLAASFVLLALSLPAWCAKKVDLDYHVKLLPPERSGRSPREPVPGLGGAQS